MKRLILESVFLSEILFAINIPRSLQFFAHAGIEDGHQDIAGNIADNNQRRNKQYCCLHNWDDGCFCRKPKPGLLYQAQREWSCDLTRAVVFGDDERDMQAGAAAGCRCEQVTEERPLLKAVEEYLEETKA